MMEKRGNGNVYKFENFCNMLLKLRKERGWTQTELAERIGISPQSVSKWERAIGYPDVSLFPTIAEIFGIPIGVLFGDATVEADKRFGMECEQDRSVHQSAMEYGHSIQRKKQNVIFSYQYRDGSLTEICENGKFYFLYNDGEEERIYRFIV